ncbi:hypothetical protein, conserved [Plasmodium ovale curtisi]|uniref:Uncharacterized protein n=1 Tax=Plasmodium ovale curtisi TaxID=864141 RepID=A0A1A8W9M1_PLAOA|nr:hypothetical protein, conserved [Plasmodium ovale curtisi]SBS97875.1 hypothetical protein, conserved [Plasmodium ovale curtisi]
MITDSEAPSDYLRSFTQQKIMRSYNFNSDDEAPCEYLNDIYAISEDTFSFKIIKQLGEGYHSPGNGHKVKIIYYELGFEDNITTASVYLGKNDKIPYICEIAVKCMKPNEVCIIQAPKSFIKIFKNSEKKRKYDKKENFKVAFKKALRFKQKCVKEYSSFPTVLQFKSIKISSNDIELLLRKKKIRNKNNTENEQKGETNRASATNTGKGDKENNVQNTSSINNAKYREDMNEEGMLQENTDFLTLEDINHVRYKFLKEKDLCTYVVYLKDFSRVDILNDDNTIIKEVIKEGKGIVTPKKNDYIDFFIEEEKKKEYIHTIFDLENLKYRGLFKVLQNMKKKEMSKIILKDLECFHIYYSGKYKFIKQGKDINTINVCTTQNKREFFTSSPSNRDNNGEDNNMNNAQTSCNNMGKNGKMENSDMENEYNYGHSISKEHPRQRKEIILELVDFKKSKTVNIKSIVNLSVTDKLLFYVYEKDKKKYFNKPTIDAECELIINLSIGKDMNKTKNSKLFLPIRYCHNDDDIKRDKAYFLFSYGSCFTSPLWFYECFKGLKEGDEVVIPLSKNKNIFSENHFVYQLIFDDIKEDEPRKIQETKLKTLSPSVNQIIYKLNNIQCKCKSLRENAKRRSNTNAQWMRGKMSDEENFLQSLISCRNKGKGFFIINGLKKQQVNRFCDDFFSLQNCFIEKISYQEEFINSPFYHSAFRNVKRKKFCNKIINIQRGGCPSRVRHGQHKSQHFSPQQFGRHRVFSSFYKRASHGEKTNGTGINNRSFHKALKSVYFDKSFYQKDAILKIKIVKLICKKKDPWNMNVSEQMENLKIYNEMGNRFMKKGLYNAASLYYKKGFDVFRFSKIYNIIFEEKKLSNLDLENDDQLVQLTQYVERILTNLSISFYKMSNYSECINFAEKAGKINPHNVKSIYWKHMAYLQQNKYAEVIQNLNNAFCLNDVTLLKLYNTARLIKKKHDDNFNSLFYAMYDQKGI